MTDKRQGDRRKAPRRAAGEGSASRALVPVGEVVDQSAPAKPKPAADPAFSAQLLGQGGGRKGLRGGPPVLNAARAGYLGAEYSGDNERRPPSGKITKTEI